MRYRRARWLGLALGASLVLTACSAQGGEPVSVTTPNGEVSPTAAPSSEGPSAPSTGKPARNDLKKGRVTRSLEAGAVERHRQVFVTEPCPTVVSAASPNP